MESLPATRARKQPASPRQPLGWQWDPDTRVLTITDCDGRAEPYRVLTLHADFGRAFELVKVGRDFGTFYHLHFDGATPSCTCPGGSHRGICKHLVSVAALVAGGAL